MVYIRYAYNSSKGIFTFIEENVSFLYKNKIRKQVKNKTT